MRGPGGGYLLARDAASISIADIIRAVNEPVRTTKCENGMTGCHGGSRCDTHQLWESLGLHIYRFLDAVNLDQVCRQDAVLNHIELGDVEHYLTEQAYSNRVKVEIAPLS